MAHTTADLAAFRDRLVEALATGARELQDQNGERITYRSVREIQSALATINRLISEQQGQQPKTVVFRTSKGL